jgi:hypothetical protein
MHIVIGMFVLTVLVAANVAITRYFARERQGIEGELNEISGKLIEGKRRLISLRKENTKGTDELRSWESAGKKAQADLDRINTILDARRKAQPMQYFVFDRLEGHSGNVWQVTVTAPDRGGAWAGKRQYLVVGDTERQARERAVLRFSRSSGYLISAAGASPLTELIVQMQTAEFGKAGNHGSAVT